jgi:putative DNA primase/helicase
LAGRCSIPRGLGGIHEKRLGGLKLNVAERPASRKDYIQVLTIASSNKNLVNSSVLADLKASAAHIALGYTKRGWNPVPVPYKTKVPVGQEWQRRVIRDVDVPRFFNGGPQNIGVQMGASSGGLTDIDLDCPEAVAIASWILPSTPAIFGRASNRASHRLYRTDLHDAVYGAEEKFQDPKRIADGVAKVTLLEIRIGGKDAQGEIKGAQTVFPGSVHESGEEIKWEEAGEPAQVDGGDLVRRAKLLAAGCLFARYWPGTGIRQDAALALGGFLARAGVPTDQIKCLAEGIARAAGDEEYRKRVDAACDSARGHLEGKPNIFGFPKVEEIFGERVAKKIAGWLGYSEPRSNTTRGSNSDIVTEDSAALEFVERHRDDLRYCHDRKSWFRWDGVRWVEDNCDLAFQWAREMARDMARDQDPRGKFIMGRVAFAGNVERYAKSDPAIAVTSEFWDRDPWLLGTPDGTVDLKTGELRPSERADGITKTTLAAPARAGECPLWIKFLNEATRGDQDLIRFLQQWCGYCLTGITCEHALVFVYGLGGNGKSVFVNTIMAVMKDYAVTCATETLAESLGDRHPTELAALQGARLVAAAETERGKAWAEAKIKKMTGGDRIKARFMRQDEFEYRPQFKLTVVGNNKPTLKNVDEAMRRRFNIVPFPHKPEVPDRELEAKLVAEAPAILQWMIDGCLDWQANGLIRPPVVVKATEEYFSDQETFPRWLEECCDGHPDGTVQTASSALYKSWVDYCKLFRGEPGGRSDFKTKMEEAGYRGRHTNKGTQWVGIALRPSGE